MSHPERNINGLSGIAKNALLSELVYRLKIIATKKSASTGEWNPFLEYLIKVLKSKTKNKH